MAKVNGTTRVDNVPGSWGSGGGGGGGGGSGAVANGVLYETSTTITANYTLTAGKNAMMVGPLLINTGVTLTIPTGQRLVIF